MNYSVFGKAMQNVQKHRYIDILRLQQQQKRRNYSLSESNYHTTRHLAEDLLTKEWEKLKY